MARKLYIFAIGGTGSRVLKSFTMLLASGCKLKSDFDTVVPIIIDPDTANADVNRTKSILSVYQEIRNQVKQPDDFFAQEIKTVNELADKSASINPDFFQFNLKNVRQTTFGEYIGFNTMESDYQDARDDKSFTRLLYSQANLDSDLDVGFKGNPNMGSIVLNQFTESENFKRFAQTFSDGDAVFIINSIFGGTGAAGFPLLLKSLRGDSELPNSAKINDALIGGITYLPYFALNKKDEIDSDSFEDKAKIAIDYYNRTIIEPNKINSMYFIGNMGNTEHLEYAVGGKDQKNNANFLELAGALAIMDFCENSAKTSETIVKEFGIENNSDVIGFGDLNLGNQEEIVQPLTKYKLFSEYLIKGLPKALNVSRWTKSNIQFVKKIKNSQLDKNYFSSPEYQLQIATFNQHFLEWLREMENHKPTFCPFNAVSWDNALNLLKNVEAKGNASFKSIDTENCRLITHPEFQSTDGFKHTALIKVFGNSTETVLKKHNVLKNETNG